MVSVPVFFAVHGRISYVCPANANQHQCVEQGEEELLTTVTYHFIESLSV